MIMPRTLVVVLNWNGAELTARCLEALAAQTYSQFKILVIDNGSTRQPWKARHFPKGLNGEVMSLESNQGFAAGMNIGFDEARRGLFDYAWLLNQDTLPTKNCLEELISYMTKQRDAVLATPRLVDSSGGSHHVGGEVEWETMNLRYRVATDLQHVPKHHAWITGAALFVRVGAYPDGPLFDPRFFAYWEDVDLSIRTALNGGTLAVVDQAVVHHCKSSAAPSPQARYLFTRNAVLFFRKHAKSSHFPRPLLTLAARAVYEAGCAQRVGEARAAAAILRGLTAAVLRRYGAPPEIEAPNVLERAAMHHFWGLSALLERASGVGAGPRRTTAKATCLDELSD